jgi:uncharacterized protein (TIGR03083 family)
MQQDRGAPMSQPDTPRSPEVGVVSPLATQLSSIAYTSGFMCLSFVGLFLALPFLSTIGVVHWYQLLRVQIAFFLITVMMSLSSFVAAIVAFYLMRKVPESVIEIQRAGIGMLMGFTALCVPVCVYIGLWSGLLAPENTHSRMLMHQHREGSRMQPAGPIFVNNLFEPMLDRLLQLLRSLSEQEWGNATPCAGWTVKDLALHLLGDEIGQLSRGRDKDFSSLLPPGADLVERINKNNALWVEAMRRMSPRLLCDLLDVTGHQVVDYFKSLDLMAMNGTVSWVGPDPAPVWLDVAREYTERWHHQQHIREPSGSRD